MAETQKVSEGIESAATMLEQLGKAFSALESHKESSLEYKIEWDEVKEHFLNLERALKDKFDEVKVKERALQEKRSEAHGLIAEKEAAFAVKEYASLARIQEIKDSVVSSIAEARQKYKVASPELIDMRATKEKKVSTSLNDNNAPNSASEEKNTENTSGKVHAQLKQLCEQMDAKGLLKFILENRKILAIIREELSVLLKHATEPARLVLDSLEGFYPPDLPFPPENEDHALQGLRRSCLVLMESATPLFGLTEQGVNHLVNCDLIQQAKATANEWKPKLAALNLDVSNGYSLEAQAFLQLLATFSIASEFDEDELCKLVVAVSRRRQAPELCRLLGLTHKMPGVIEDLVSKGRHIDAVHFAHAFQLTDEFPPVPMLKAYLQDLKDSEETNGDKGAAVQQKDSTAKEIGALKAVIRCIEEYKLQEEFPLDPLQVRVAELEKAKADKKRTNDTSKFQSKKPLGAGGFASRRQAAVAYNWYRPPAIVDHRAPYAGIVERYPYNARPSYEAPIHHPRYGQANAQRAYLYPEERIPSVPYGASSNYGSYASTGLHSGSSNYASSMGTGLPSSSSTYGSYSSANFRSSHQSYSKHPCSICGVDLYLVILSY